MTNPVIPAEVVEVAVRATYEAAFGTGWELEEDEFREDIRQSIRIALEAATPHIRAQAWEEGYTLGYADCANKQLEDK